jgi:hypothetical protein
LGVIYLRVKKSFDILNHYIHLHNGSRGAGFDDNMLAEYLRLSQQSSSSASSLALTFSGPETTSAPSYAGSHIRVVNVSRKLPQEIVPLEFLVDILERVALRVRHSTEMADSGWTYSWCFQMLYECGASLQELCLIYNGMWLDSVQGHKAVGVAVGSGRDFWIEDEAFSHLRQVLINLLDEWYRKEGRSNMNAVADMRQQVRLFVRDSCKVSPLDVNELEHAYLFERLQRIRHWVFPSAV